MARSKAQVKADTDAALAMGAKVTVLPVAAKGKRKGPTPQVDAIPGTAPLGLSPQVAASAKGLPKVTLSPKAQAAAERVDAKAAAKPKRVKGVAKAAKPVAPKGGRLGRFANDGARLVPVDGAPVRTGVLGHIQAQVAAGKPFGAIRDSLAAEFAAAKADPQRFAVRFVGRALRRGLVRLAG